MIGFVECDTCRAKPGSPALCGGCLNNRVVIASLTQLVQASRHQHYHCDDSFYCCRKCDSPDHGGRAEDEPCTCGADTWNERVDKVLGGYECQ